nr:aldehyde dehydrogenase family protein [Acidisarcina polymorpha]
MGADRAFQSFRKVSVHQRAKLLTSLAVVLRREKAALATVVTREMGKLTAEAEAEIEKCVTEADWHAEHGPQMSADAPAATDKVEGKRRAP